MSGRTGRCGTAGARQTRQAGTAVEPRSFGKDAWSREELMVATKLALAEEAIVELLVAVRALSERDQH